MAEFVTAAVADAEVGDAGVALRRRIVVLILAYRNGKVRRGKVDVIAAVAGAVTITAAVTGIVVFMALAGAGYCTK